MKQEANKMGLFKIVAIIMLMIMGIFSSHSYGSDFEIKLSKNTVSQGDTIKVDIESKEFIKKVTVSFNNKYYKAFKKIRSKTAPFQYRLYLGISRYQKTGAIPLKIWIETKDNEKLKKTAIIKVKSGDFRKSIVNLSPKKTKLQNNKKQFSNEASLIGSKFRGITPSILFSKPFIKPTRGRKSSPFGAYRVYNNKDSSSRHSGVDISNKKGTEIVASNKGTIVLASTLTNHGKTVIIDHGWGIMTIYNHMSKISVKENQMVGRGNKIAEMGSTGVATGPHVHWGLSIQNTRVDPLFWLENPSLYD